MSVFREGTWHIETVLVNKETVMNNEGFTGLEVSDNEIVIQPVGMRFKVEQETMHSAIMESRGQVYFADWTVDNTAIELVISRPDVKDTITFSAKRVEAPVPSVV